MTKLLPAGAICPLPYCNADLELILHGNIPIDDDPMPKPSTSHALVVAWEVQCHEGHVLESGADEIDGRGERIGYRIGQSLAGLR